MLLLFTYITTALSEDHYKLLGIWRNANNKQLNKAFKKLALIWHLDKNLKKNQDIASENFKLLHAMYELLIDPECRRAYDEDLERGNLQSRDKDGNYDWYQYM